MALILLLLLKKYVPGQEDLTAPIKQLIETSCTPEFVFTNFDTT